MGMCLESTTDDDCQRLRDETDLIEERPRERNNTMCVCVCEEDAIIIIVPAERTREISLISFCAGARTLSLSAFWIVYEVGMHERMYTINKVPCLFPRCVCRGRRKRHCAVRLSLSLPFPFSLS